MITKKLGRGLGMATMVLAVVGVPAVSAYADNGNTCYVSCSPPTTSGGGTTGGGSGSTPGGGGSGTRPPVTKSAGGSGSPGSSSGASGGNAATTVSTKAAGGGLPFTGADVEEMTIGGVGALLVGAGLLRRSRSRRRAGI
jgi:hypothetical protein